MENKSDTIKAITESIWMTLWTYLFMMCFVLSLYTKGTYMDLGNTKFYLYRIFSVIGAGILLVLITILAFLKKPEINFYKKIKITDIVMFFFLLTNLITYLFSIDKSESGWGTTGWNLGFFTWTFFIFYYFIFSKYMKWKEYLWYIFLVPGFVVMLMGILNRFGIFSIYGSGTDTFFLSTIGNINWYCGYLSVFLPIGTSLLIVGDNTIKGHKLLILYVLIGYVAAMTQGSTSILIILGVMHIVLLLVCLSERKMWITYLRVCLICGLSLEISRFLIKIYGYDYDPGNLCIEIVNNRAGLILFGAAFFLISLSKLLGEMNIQWRQRTYKGIAIALIIAGVITATIMFLNGFDDEWGNGRGFIWKYSIELFGELNIKRKLFGIGQDYFAGYSYSKQELALILDNRFGNARLTNAHNEFLTLTINNGIVGLLSYLFVIGTFIHSFISKYKKDKNKFALVFLVCLISYTCNNMISFAQIMSTPYLFIIIGIGQAAVNDSDFILK